MKLLAKLLLLLAGGFAADQAWAAEPENSPSENEQAPNLILVLLDDVGWGDFSCFGNTDAQTPNLDRLAAEGLRFTQFYVNSPICSPSRCALTTGQYPQRWRISSYLADRAENERRGVAHWLDPAAPTIPRMLHEAGYTTGHFGKWHLGGQRDVGEAPLITEYGFDESLTNFEGLGPRLLGLADAHDGKPPRRHALGSDKLGRGPVIWHDRTRLTDGYLGAAVAFMNHAAEARKPFYVNVWPDDAHSPYFPPKDKRGDGSKRQLYLGVLENLDAQLGALFDHVRQSPVLRDNTLVLVCSDNGHEPGAGTAGMFRGAKTTLYEGGIRSPLIVWGPGLVGQKAHGTTNSDSVLSSIDLAASLLALANIPPARAAELDGEVLPDTLLGRGTASRQAPLCWRRPPDRKSWHLLPGTYPDLAIRDGSWKLLCGYDGGDVELYRLDRDPGETTNLASEQPETAQRLTAALLAWHRVLPPDKGPELGAPAP